MSQHLCITTWVILIYFSLSPLKCEPDKSFIETIVVRLYMSICTYRLFWANLFDHLGKSSKASRVSSPRSLWFFTSNERDILEEPYFPYIEDLALVKLEIWPLKLIQVNIIISLSEETSPKLIQRIWIMTCLFSWT